MYKQVLISFLLLYCTSCNYFFSNTKQSLEKLDTIIDFTKVDVSPSFKICNDLIDNAKTNCFRANMQLLITRNLSFSSFTTKSSINETITVILFIDKAGKVSLKKIESSQFIKEEIPKLVNIIEKAIEHLPKLQPAIKRGIPVSTQYKLPIKIKSKD